MKIHSRYTIKKKVWNVLTNQNALLTIGGNALLVFNTTGGMSLECEKLNKRLAVLISEKTKEQYCHVVSHIRTKLLFSLLKAIVIAIHGYRGKPNGNEREENELALSDISFNLIPDLPR